MIGLYMTELPLIHEHINDNYGKAKRILIFADAIIVYEDSSEHLPPPFMIRLNYFFFLLIVEMYSSASLSSIPFIFCLI